MKRLLILCCILFAPFYVSAQTASYTVNGTELELRTDVEGPLTLLWNIIDQEYRYFIKKEETIVAIVNEKVGTTVSKLDLRLGGFVGITNSVFTNNPENISNSQLGVDFEILDAVALPRHAIVVQYKQTLSSDEFDFSSSQFSINHRFKFVNSEKIAVYLNTKLITYTRSSRGDSEIDEEIALEIEELNDGGNFQGPILFGLGADIALGKGFLTLNYHDAYSFFLDDNGEFPVDVSIGYKFNL